LKKSGSIEGDLPVVEIARQARFSALKKSGSIEGGWRCWKNKRRESIFRFEKKRLH